VEGKQENQIKMLMKEICRLRKELRPASKRLYTVNEAAHYLGLRPKTIRNRLGPQAENPFPVKPLRKDGPIRFRKEDLDEYVDTLSETASDEK
jgi:hypothetical protein